MNTNAIRHLIGFLVAVTAAGCATGTGSAGGAYPLAGADVCADVDYVGAPCDVAAFADCVRPDDFAAACRCVSTGDATERGIVDCGHPSPVPVDPPWCDREVRSGAACDDIRIGTTCASPAGGRCICQEDPTDPRVPAIGRATWICEGIAPDPIPRCGADVGPGVLCGSDATRCLLDERTVCGCGLDATIDGLPRWECASIGPAPTSDEDDCEDGTLSATFCPRSAIGNYCAADDGTACRCTTLGSSRPYWQCEVPPPPPAAFCPAEVLTGARVRCEVPGDTCDAADGGLACVCRPTDDGSRDPSATEHHWDCATSGPPIPAGSATPA